MLKYFIDLVELRTKIISVFGFSTALLYYFAYLRPIYGINYLNFILFFIAMLLFDMATTAINNYSALLYEKNLGEYDKDIVSDMNKFNITMKGNLLIIIVLVSLSAIIGLFIVYNSNITVLLLGALCFLIGIAYTYGPKPIAYTPTGELFAGGAMGVILPIIAIFTQFDHPPFELNPLILIIFMPLAFYIGSILYANNLCDLDQDVSNGRYTLAYYTKREIGGKLLMLSIWGAYGFIILSVIIGYYNKIFLSPIFLLTLLAYPLFRKNVLQFSKHMNKKKCFPLITKNFAIFALIYNILFIIDIIF